MGCRIREVFFRKSGANVLIRLIERWYGTPVALRIWGSAEIRFELRVNKCVVQVPKLPAFLLAVPMGLQCGEKNLGRPPHISRRNHGKDILPDMLAQNLLPVLKASADFHEDHIRGLSIYSVHGKQSGLGMVRKYHKSTCLGFPPNRNKIIDAAEARSNPRDEIGLLITRLKIGTWWIGTVEDEIESV